MAGTSRKRARASSKSNKHEPSIDRAQASKIAKSIATLKPDIVGNILLEAAIRNPDVATLVESHAASVKQSEQAKVVDFSHHSKSVWKTINVTYSRLSGSKQFDASGDAFHSVVKVIKEIRKQCPAHASLNTKVSALETLRKIAKTIILSAGDVVAHEVRKEFQSDSILEDTMMGIIQSMTPEERETASSEPHEDVTWIEKVAELKEIADENCLFEDMAGVIEMLSPGFYENHEVIDLEEDESDD